MVDWFVGRSVNQSVCQLIGLVGPSVDLSVGPSVGWSVRRLVGPLDPPVTAHLAKRYIGHFICYFNFILAHLLVDGISLLPLYRFKVKSICLGYCSCCARGTKECRKFGLRPSCFHNQALRDFGRWRLARFVQGKGDEKGRGMC